MPFSHIYTIDGSPLFTSDNSPIGVLLQGNLDISCPANISIVTPYNAPVKVAFLHPTVTGGVPPYTISSNPASGSEFSVGTTEVITTVTDSFDNVALCNFTVTVSAAQPVGCSSQLSNEFDR